MKTMRRATQPLPVAALAGAARAGAIVALAAGLAAALAACGQKGPLYIQGYPKDTPWPINDHPRTDWLTPAGAPNAKPGTTPASGSAAGANAGGNAAAAPGQAVAPTGNATPPANGAPAAAPAGADGQ